MSAAARRSWAIDGSPGLFRAGPAEPCMGRAERGFEIADQTCKGPRQRRHPRDQNIVAACQPIKGKHAVCRGFQPSARPVARNGIADLPARRKSDPYRAMGFGWHTTFQNQSCRSVPDAARGAEKLLPPFQPPETGFSARRRRACAGDVRQAESRLRPWARRRDSTLRPPAVAIRARKPCRRLRTILLGW